ncbi:formylglycine-generating enzyme family protein [Chondrinema litorale]|uniref:formylglycine-generating enzyme family protein n=1 Tax=Chondrinema litorale TaxID=2994555 RepID=UPI002543F8F5|nr:SUMF1/EgtB/PvdO family nonheme iron enzyme [Chondrinema litorale]UZR94309.1 SUMF1/EgtB/PvdO family nonheme iron enzyme [Chondrinema litorale]
MHRVLGVLLFGIVLLQISCSKIQRIKDEQPISKKEKVTVNQSLATTFSRESQQQNQMENLLLVDPIKPTEEPDLFELLPDKVTVPEDMVFVPGGEYLEKDGNVVGNRMIKGFLIDKKPISYQEYKDYIEITQPKDIHFENVKFISSSDLKNTESAVVLLSWFEANAYCNSQGKRLPDAFEWKHAVISSQKDATLKDYKIPHIWEWTNNWKMREGDDVYTFVPDAYSKKVILSSHYSDNNTKQVWDISSVEPEEKKENIGCRCVQEIYVKP